VFDALHVGAVFRHRGREVTVTSVDAADPPGRAACCTRRPRREGDPRLGRAGVLRHRGWPATVTVYQDRLVIGGSRGLPDWVWMSRTGRHFDFELSDPDPDVGVLDDHAIALRLAGRRAARGPRPPARPAAPGLHLGRRVDRARLPAHPLERRGRAADPRRLLGEAAGPARRRRRGHAVRGASGRELREYLFAESEQAYQAADIALLARHLLRDPVDMTFDGRRRLLLIPRDDGRAAAVTIDRNSNVVAWSLLATAGRVLATAMHAGEPWFLVDLGGGVTLLERFGDAPGRRPRPHAPAADPDDGLGRARRA
jgi:hypothetical protein